MLVVGGEGTSGERLSSAEIYDPGTRSWAATVSLKGPRISHTATLLLDGRVLVVGGQSGEPAPGCNGPGCSAELTSAEVYDPTTGRWSAVQPMVVGRAGHTATRLQDGRVLVAGGVGGGRTLRSAEIFDPATLKWSTAGSMVDGRSGHASAALSDGTILVIGGYGATGPLATAERYSPAVGRWAGAGTLPEGSVGTATVLGDGRVLFAGGDTGLAHPHSAELFDPVAGDWSDTGAMITARQSHVAALLPDGRVLAAGGQNTTLSATQSLGSLSSAEIYDPTTGTWTATVALTQARSRATATSLPDGTVLVVGGDINGGVGRVPTDSAEIFTEGG